jgi:hypothetical protein
MNRHDQEIEQLKASVSCATVLERLPPVWQLDAVESTRRSLKYRRGAGEIVIVNHDGRGWCDPLSTVNFGGSAKCRSSLFVRNARSPFCKAGSRSASVALRRIRPWSTSYAIVSRSVGRPDWASLAVSWIRQSAPRERGLSFPHLPTSAGECDVHDRGRNPQLRQPARLVPPRRATDASAG